MHVTTKETDQDGVHILTSVVEADGAFQLASDKASISASVISTQRTDSGGIKVQVAVKVAEPVPEVPKAAAPPKPQPTAQEQALAYFKEKGLSDSEAESALERFGVDRVLKLREQELNSELAAIVERK